DASSDATIDLINTYRDDRLVRHFNSTNIGYVKNFEQAISLCTGEFIALCDQDDMWRPDKIELLVQNSEDSLLIFADSALIDQDDEYLYRNISDLRNLKNCNFVGGYTLSKCV